MLKLSIWSSYYIDLSPEDAIRELEKNKITYCELSTEHAAQLLERGNIAETGRCFGEYARQHHVEITQGHLQLECRLCAKHSVATLKDWIMLFDAIGIKNAVLHCDHLSEEPQLSAKEVLDRNIEKLRELDDFLQKTNVTICLENLRRVTQGVDDLLYCINQVDSEHFAICLDTGHLNLVENKNQREFILKAGAKLKALHIADNDCSGDQHLMPFCRGTVDFAAVVKALYDINYSGLFNLEIPGENRRPLEIRSYKIQYIIQVCKYLEKIGAEK